MKVRLSVIATAIMALGIVLAAALPATAACHRFDLEVEPPSVDEGGSVTVTVSRDGAVDDSSVRVTSSSGTATAGDDFAELDEQISFSGDSLSESVTVDVIDDGVAEGVESFTVGLSDPGGCAINPNFQMAADITVSINPSEAAISEPADDSDDPADDSDDDTDTGADDADTGDDEDDDDGSGVGMALFIVGGVVIVGAAVVLLMRRRSS